MISRTVTKSKVIIGGMGKREIRQLSIQRQTSKKDEMKLPKISLNSPNLFKFGWIRS